MRKIWAVAINTIKQALRMKIAISFTVILVVLLPVMAFSMTGDGTLKGRLQSFVSYGISLTALLLSTLTIVVACYSLTSDINQKQIYTVITKPIRRFQLLLGKILGIILLDCVLLVLFSAAIYAFAIYLPQILKADPAEIARAKNEFFIAKASLTPQSVDVSVEVEQLYKKMEQEHQLPPDLTSRQIKSLLMQQKLIEKRAAAPGQEVVWEFNDVVPLKRSDNIFIRYKYDVSVNPQDLQVYGMWVIGDIRQLKSGIMKTQLYQVERKDAIRTFTEFQVSADAVADDGFLGVAFLNNPINRTVVIFPPPDSFEVLYKADSFAANYIRTVLLILTRLVFLAALGTFASSFLSFPVAALLCFAVFSTASISSFVLDSFDYLGQNIGDIYSYTIKPLLMLLPQFDKYSPADYLIQARIFSWPLLAQVTVVLVGIKAVLMIILAVIIFSCREIAKITV